MQSIALYSSQRVRQADLVAPHLFLITKGFSVQFRLLFQSYLLTICKCTQLRVLWLQQLLQLTANSLLEHIPTFYVYTHFFLTLKIHFEKYTSILLDSLVLLTTHNASHHSSSADNGWRTTRRQKIVEKDMLQIFTEHPAKA